MDHHHKGIIRDRDRSRDRDWGWGWGGKGGRRREKLREGGEEGWMMMGMGERGVAEKWW